MAPTKLNPIQNKQNKATWVAQFKGFLTFEGIKRLLTDPHHIAPVCVILFLVEAVLNVFIIEKVKYTEIDWVAYMQEVEGFLNGTLDYKNLKGNLNFSCLKLFVTYFNFR